MLKKPILIIEDDQDLINLNGSWLVEENIKFAFAKTLKKAKILMSMTPPSIIILDIGMPDGSGFDFCKQVRKSSNVPIIFITGRTDEASEIEGFTAGGDDYIVKPYKKEQFMARINAVIRRLDNEIKHIMNFPPLTIDILTQEVKMGDTLLSFTKNEFILLSLLASNEGETLSATQLFEHLSGEKSTNQIANLRVHISSIRRKLCSTPKSPFKIETHSASGYSFTYEVPKNE